jgi:hypothetical protein
MEREGKYIDMFKRILLGLNALDTDVVFLCEDDVVYNKTHFDFIPPKDNVYYYNTNFWQIRHSDGYAINYESKRLSCACAYRKILIEYYEKVIKIFEEGRFSRKVGFEPGTHKRPERVNDYKFDTWESELPVLDIVHQNATKRRFKIEEFRKKPKYWKVAENGVIPNIGKWKDYYGRDAR